MAEQALLGVAGNDVFMLRASLQRALPNGNESSGIFVVDLVCECLYAYICLKLYAGARVCLSLSARAHTLIRVLSAMEVIYSGHKAPASGGREAANQTFVLSVAARVCEA